MLYIHDTLELFGPSLEALRGLWSEKVGPAIAQMTSRRVSTLSRELFANVTDTIREAARIPQDRALKPEDIRATCSQGLEAILHPPAE